MSFSFPPNPSVGQVYSTNGKSFKWNGVSWTSTKIESNKNAPVFISSSPPANAIEGSLWYDNNNGTLNVYYTDLNGSQWVNVNPQPEDTINTTGGTFDGPIYANYEIPVTANAFVTVGWTQSQISTFLASNAYIKAGPGIVLDSQGVITGIDSGLYE